VAVAYSYSDTLTEIPTPLCWTQLPGRALDSAISGCRTRAVYRHNSDSGGLPPQSRAMNRRALYSASGQMRSALLVARPVIATPLLHNGYHGALLVGAASVLAGAVAAAELRVCSAPRRVMVEPSRHAVLDWQ
jgi:hypothetical protein